MSFKVNKTSRGHGQLSQVSTKSYLPGHAPEDHLKKELERTNSQPLFQPVNQNITEIEFQEPEIPQQERPKSAPPTKKIKSKRTRTRIVRKVVRKVRVAEPEPVVEEEINITEV